MNVYQTASNHHYYNPHNLLISSPSSASSIYSTVPLNDEHFYQNIDNANSSLIHMFINNSEERLDRKMSDQFYPNSSSVYTTTFNSPSPSSSFNSSNGSGQMIMNWTSPNSQASCQEDPVVLCPLDELTKNLNIQMIKAEEKNDKIMNQNSEVFYNSNLSTANMPYVQTQIEHIDQLTLTSYEFNSNSIISQKLTEANLYSNRLPNQTLVDSTLLIPPHHQFNTNSNQIQSSIVDNHQRNHNISNLHHSLTSTNSPAPLNTTIIHNSISPIKSSLVSSMVLSKSTIQQSPYKSAISPSIQSKNNNSSIQTAIKINQTSIGKNSQLQQANQSPTNRFPINQINCNGNKLKQENSTINICNPTTSQLLNGIIGYDSEGRPIRNTANKKERKRTLSINNAFSNLRDCIPNVPADTKLSKIKTLRLATSYISYLMELLDDSAPINNKRRLMMPDDFKVDLQRFKGRSKNSIHLIYPAKFNDKQFNPKSSTPSNLDNINNLSNQTYLTQQTTIQTFHQTSLTSSTNCVQDTIKYEENKLNNCNTKTNTIHQQQSYNQMSIMDTSEHYDQSNKRIKGRTGWPQHVIKNEWASEL